jgi:hypothetical protein
MGRKIKFVALFAVTLILQSWTYCVNLPLATVCTTYSSGTLSDGCVGEVYIYTVNGVRVGKSSWVSC